jgi:hypothetical protein
MGTGWTGDDLTQHLACVAPLTPGRPFILSQPVPHILTRWQEVKAILFVREHLLEVKEE